MTPPPVTLAQMVEAVRNAADAVSVSGTTRWENAPEVACKFWGSETALRAAAAALRAAAAALEGMGWRDIASAPRDGTQVLICGGSVCCDAYTYPVPLAGTVMANWDDLHHCWDAGWAEGSQDVYVVTEPTHWQPLPLPPASATEG